jgi:site-specific DNA-methyltransferase (adenine-specific)
MKTIEDKSIDLIYTDPPYACELEGGGGTVNTCLGLHDSLKKIKPIVNSGYNIERFCNECMRIMKEPNIYIWCNKKQIPAYFDFFINKHDCTFDILFWNKVNALPTFHGKYLTDCEYLLYFRKGSGKCYPQNYEDAKTAYYSPINNDYKLFGHPTIKPLDFVLAHIRNSSNENDLVLDPFMGSGTTGVACKRLNRDFIGIEIDKTYFETAKNRIENNTVKTNNKLKIKSIVSNK